MILITPIHCRDFFRNRFSGTIPGQFGGLLELNGLIAGRNSLHGTVPEQLRPLLIDHCEYSGLENLDCAQECPGCRVFEFTIRHCDDKGLNQKCISGYYLLPALVIYVAMVAFGLKTIAPPNTPFSIFVLEAMTAAFGIADTVAAVGFALTTTHHVLFVASITLLGCLVASSFIVTVIVISRAATLCVVFESDENSSSVPEEERDVLPVSSLRSHLTIDGSDDQNDQNIELQAMGPTQSPSRRIRRYVNERFRAHVYSSTVLLAYTVTFCALNIRVLPFIVGNELLERLLAGSFVVNSKKRRIPDAVTDTSFSNRTNNLSSRSFQNFISAQILPMSTSAFETQPNVPASSNGLRLRGMAGLLTLFFGDIPQLVVQLLGAYSGDGGKYLIMAVVMSVTSIIVECSYLIVCHVLVLCLRVGQKSSRQARGSRIWMLARVQVPTEN
eukprot:c1297_g1_i1.p1 GENE.c1297_g1_i1~~c1297_g1_i1.p1  ORF type:complete len:443 (+),score=98.02 c1297_g1_i1:1153-2481(+)